MRISFWLLKKTELKAIRFVPVQASSKLRHCRIIHPLKTTAISIAMKLVHKDIIPQGPGSVKMVPEESDDLWHVYNLVSKGDRVFSVTVRKVQRELSSGVRDVERVKLKLEIEVEAIDYDNVGAVLRIRGKNVSENEHVKFEATGLTSVVCAWQLHLWFEVSCKGLTITVNIGHHNIGWYSF
eukprot:Gb_14055 [translate_table: standard]